MHAKSKCQASIRFVMRAALAICLASGQTHAGDASAQAFDHFATGFPLTGAHVTVDCESCHQGGRFKGTPRKCSDCHNGTIAAGKPAQHPVTTGSCESCHNAEKWKHSATYDHSQALGTCASCHDGKLSPGKPANHAVTSAPCATCHKSVFSWKGAGFDHTGVKGGCATCHNGQKATGQAANHVPTNVACETCHKSTTSFAGAKVHRNIMLSTGCAACHQTGMLKGIVAAKPANHVPTNAECNTCHRTFTSFRGAKFDHAAIAAEETQSSSFAHQLLRSLSVEPISGLTLIASCRTERRLQAIGETEHREFEIPAFTAEEARRLIAARDPSANAAEIAALEMRSGRNPIHIAPAVDELGRWERNGSHVEGD